MNTPTQSRFWETAAFARVFPFAVFIGLLMLEGALKSAFPALSTEPYSHWFYPLRCLLTIGALAIVWSKLIELRPLAEGITIGWFSAATLIGALIILMWILIGPMVRIGAAPKGINPIPSDANLAILWLTFRFVGTALVVPIIEELFFRSFLMRYVQTRDFLNLSPNAVGWFGVISSSIVFAMEHKEILAGFIAGLAFVWIYRLRNNLRDAIVAHAAANAILFAYVVTTGSYHFWG